MKIFLPVFLAILAAASVIWGVHSFAKSNEESIRRSMAKYAEAEAQAARRAKEEREARIKAATTLHCQALREVRKSVLANGGSIDAEYAGRIASIIRARTDEVKASKDQTDSVAMLDVCSDIIQASRKPSADASSLIANATEELRQAFLK